MFETLRSSLATAVYDSSRSREQAAGLANATIARVAALGVDLTVPDPVVTGAIRPSDAAMLATAHCTNGPARDLISTLAAQLAPLQAGTAWTPLTLASNAVADAGTTPQGRTVANKSVQLAGQIRIRPGYLLANAALFTVPAALAPGLTQRITLANVPPTTDDPALTIAAGTGVVTVGVYMAAGLVVYLDGTTYPL